MMWTKPVLHWFSNIVNKSCVVRKASHYPSQSQGSFHQKYNNLTITLFLHCFYDEVLQDSSNFWDCIWMKSLGVTTHTNKTSLVVLSNTSKVLFYNVLLINYHLSRFAFEMATKIDNRVRFASQSTSILNMRCSACFCEYQDTENILFCDWLPYSLNHRTFYPDVVSSALHSDWNGRYYYYRYFAKIESKARFQHGVLQRSADECLWESKIHRCTDALLTWLSMIRRVNVFLNRTLVDRFWSFNNLCGSHLQRPLELYHVSWWYLTLVIDLIDKWSHDVIGCVTDKLS